MIYHVLVIGEEADFFGPYEPLQASNIHDAARQVRSILAKKSVWAYGVDPFTTDVVIRSADNDATIKMPVQCATE